MRVLLVDDSKVFLDVLVELAEAAGVEPVATATSGEDALLRHDEHRPDAVVLDVRLPGIDGHEVAARIRSVDPRTRIVLLSATDECDHVLAKGALSPARLRAALGLA